MLKKKNTKKQFPIHKQCHKKKETLPCHNQIIHQEKQRKMNDDLLPVL